MSLIPMDSTVGLSARSHGLSFVFIPHGDLSPLRVTGNIAVEIILADIPFFVVGMTALGLSIFFLVMRRVNILAVFIFSSGLAAFMAAILNLILLLIGIRRQGASNNVTSSDLLNIMSSMVPISIAREVMLSVSIGFRLCFFWCFIASRPHGEPEASSSPTESKPDLQAPLRGRHSASWNRFGGAGWVLGRGLLIVVLAIPVLNIVWRSTGIANKMTPVYLASNVVDILASALFMAKLAINISLSPLSPVTRPLLLYIAPIFALILEVGIVTSNCLVLVFSESPLGRLLQAIELYVLMLFLLLSTFWFHTAPEEDFKKRARKIGSFIGLPEIRRHHSAFLLNPPIIATPEPAFVPEASAMDFGNVASEPISPSADSGKSSTMLLIRQPQPSLDGDTSKGEKLDQPTDGYASQNKSLNGMFGSEAHELRATTFMPVPDHRARDRESDRRPSVQESASRSASDASNYSGMGPSPGPRAGSFIPSYYATTNATTSTTPYVATDYADPFAEADREYTSNVGTYRPDEALSPPQPLYHPRSPQPQDSANSFDELLRQQEDLDRSIAVLHVSPRREERRSAQPIPETYTTPNRSRSNTLIAGSTLHFSRPFTTSSQRSDPSVDAPQARPKTRESGHSSARNTSKKSQAPRRVNRSESVGTQYDVTSFIGKLSNSGYSPTVSEVPSENALVGPGASVGAGGQNRHPSTRSRPYVDVFDLPASGDDHRPPESEPPPSSSIRSSPPPLSLTSLQNSATPYPDSGANYRTSRRQTVRGIGVPAVPRRSISRPRRLSQDGRDSDDPDAFEHPRSPPPIVL